MQHFSTSHHDAHHHIVDIGPLGHPGPCFLAEDHHFGRVLGMLDMQGNAHIDICLQPTSNLTTGAGGMTSPARGWSGEYLDIKGGRVVRGEKGIVRVYLEYQCPLVSQGAPLWMSLCCISGAPARCTTCKNNYKRNKLRGPTCTSLMSTPN